MGPAPLNVPSSSEGRVSRFDRSFGAGCVPDPKRLIPPAYQYHRAIVTSSLKCSRSYATVLGR